MRPSREDGKLDFFRRLLLLITALQWNLPLEDFLKTNNASEMECGKTRFSEGKHQRVFFLLKLELVVVPQFSRKYIACAGMETHACIHFSQLHVDPMDR